MVRLMQAKRKPKIYIPDKKSIHFAHRYGDCAPYYYTPLVGYFYRKRIKMLCGLMQQKGDQVLDIGYGSGILFYELKKRFIHLNGMDLHSDGNLVKEILKAESIKTNLTNGNLFHLPYRDASFDCVIAMSVLEHISDLKYPLDEIKRILKNDGEFICGFPTKNILLRLFFKLIGFDDKRDHPSSHSYIYRMLKEKFSVEKTLKFPAFFKDDYCLYIACRCRKK